MALPSRRSAPSTPVNLSFLDASEMDKYRLVSNIGKGSFGVISKVQRIEDGKEFALKELDYGKMNERDRKQIMAEVAILESLKHRNIVQLVQKIRDAKTERIFIIMEYCTNGDLGSLIRKAQRSNSSIHEEKIWNIFLQITLALHHCHYPETRKAHRPSAEAMRTQVLHRDLKPENVFLSGDVVKLGDFGLSKDMAGHMFTQTYVGTPLYMPPEILAENRYDIKSDIWSLGCLVYEMCALHSPFHTARTQEELISMVKSGKLPPLPSHVSPALKLVIKAMLNLNPVRRPSTKDLLDMDEMKLHRKLFTVQNQTSMLQTRRVEMEQWEARLKQREERIKQKMTELEAREFEMSEREQAFALREAEFNARHQQLSEGEDILRENQQRIAAATETLKIKWAQLRDEQDRFAALQSPVDEQPETDFGPVQAQRPPLEERKTMPVPSSNQRHAAYNDTPSKIPFPLAYNSPAPLDSKITSKISKLTARSQGSSLPRRLASKSMTNLAERAKAEAEAEERVCALATPAKQRSPRHLGRTSIGSPGELDRVFHDDITMRTASFGSPAPGSLLNSPFIPRPRKASFPDTDAEIPGLPPTLIPAPTFVYRPDATPAKWNPDDPDAPSPFLRRGSSSAGSGSGPVPSQPNFGSAGSASSSTSAASGPSRPPSGRATERDRPPLSAINAQPTAAAALAPAATVTGQPRKLPRSRSGNLSLHQHVLARNAAHAMGSAVRTRPPLSRDPTRA